MYIYNIYVHKDVVYYTYGCNYVCTYNNNIIILYLYAVCTAKILNADSVINITL